MKKTVRIILLTLGLALFAWFIQRTGWDDIRGTFETLGWFGLLVLIPYTIVFTIDTIGWRFTFGPATLKSIPFHVIWKIRLVGESINNVIRRGRDVVFASLGWFTFYLGEATWKGLREEI